MSQKNGKNYGTLSVGRMIIGLMSIKRAISLLLNFSASFLERSTKVDRYKGELYL
ncbi:hypothetical protein ACUXCC_005081 [Cytobacillus horneckiae]